MRDNSIGIPVETESDNESIFVLKVEENDKFAVLRDREGKYLTAQSEAVVLTDTMEEGSRWGMFRTSTQRSWIGRSFDGFSESSF